MKVNAGDRIVIKGHHVGDRDRVARVVEVRGTDGEPPYLVEWGDTGKTSLFFPGPDAMVQPYDEVA